MANDKKLRTRVKLLGNVLGNILRSQAGGRVYVAVEALRKGYVSLRKKDSPARREQLARLIKKTDHVTLTHIVRAFSTYFSLVNIAEEDFLHQERRRMLLEGTAWRGGFRDTLSEFLSDGIDAEQMQFMLDRLSYVPVITAHPTEAKRHTIMEMHRRIFETGKLLDSRNITADQRARLTDMLEAQVQTLWKTDEVRSQRPDVGGEIRHSIYYFQDSLFRAVPEMYKNFEISARSIYGVEEDGSPRIRVPSFLQFGSWVGGDRDGNPNVTSNITHAALDRHRTLVLRRYLADADILLHELSVSSRRVQTPAGLQLLEQSLESDRERFPDVAARAARYTVHEPWREKLWYVRARLEATLARGDDAYPRVSSYLDDLRVIERSLIECGYEFLAGCSLRDCIRRAQVFGFHLASLDLRQHSALHERAVDELLATAGHPGYADLEDEAKISLLTGMLERADLSPPVERESISPQTREILGTLDMVGRARREMGAEACQRYVVSFTNSVSDLLEVLYLARAARLAPTELRPVPLLEQLEDLDHGAAIAERMLDNVPIRAAIGDELEVMIGYSDSGKQIGYFASAVALRRAQVSLAEVAERRDVHLTVFHGRGGAIGRGGGPASRSIRAQPPEAVRGRLRATEQGETVTARYARPEIAERDLEQTVSAVLAASRAEHEQGGARERAARVALLDRAAEAAQAAYARLLADRDALARYALEATPIQLVSQLNIGSRPASRKPGSSLEQLRAIPWVFSWNQSRHGIPGWFGLGAALDCIVTDEGIDRARQLYREWPFFRALINNAQLALARADIDVASYYARLAGSAGEPIFAMIREEHERTVRRVLEVTAKQQLLGNRPHLVAAVQRRNPYVDVLSHAQVELLGRLARADGERAAIRSVLLITINGIAAGLQTAG